MFLRRSRMQMSLKSPSAEDNWKRVLRHASSGPDGFVKVPWDCGPVLTVGREQGSVPLQADSYRRRFTETTYLICFLLVAHIICVVIPMWWNSQIPCFAAEGRTFV
jgi:hypothetical protein